MKKILLAIILVLVPSVVVAARTPVARTDVIPRQWIEYGTTFTFGVVAFQAPESAEHTGSDNASTLTDSGASWTNDTFIGATIYNLTDGSSCVVTDNTATTQVCTLSGGTDNDWDQNDTYIVGGVKEVVFSISGQGYSSGTKTSTSMALNTRHADATTTISGWTGWPGVWEYYVSIPASEFTGTGSITVTPVVYGYDGGTKNLGATTLFVDGGNSHSPHECWVDIDGSDGTGTADNESDPYPSIESAISGCYTANGNSNDGNIIYLVEDLYDTIANQSTTTSSEWLTFKAASGASQANVIVADGSTIFNTTWLKFDGVTLRTDSILDYVVNNSSTNLWTQSCLLTSSAGRYANTNSSTNRLNPVLSINAHYSDDCHVTDVDRAFGGNGIIRNATILDIAEDGFQNNPFVVNVRLDGSDNGSPTEAIYHHNDVYQCHSSEFDNRIIYNYFATDAHYQGLFLRMTTAGTSNDSAIVNCLVEMRPPENMGDVGDSPDDLMADLAVYVEDGNWDHLILWHNSFPAGQVKFWGLDNSDYSYTAENISMIGNVFSTWLADAKPSDCGGPNSFDPGNSERNTALYNHYQAAASELNASYSCCTWLQCTDIDYRSKAPDTSTAETFTHGGISIPDILDITDTTNYDNFGYPLGSSVIIDALPANITGVPADVFGAERDSTPDVGAVESDAEDTTAPTVSSVTIGTDGETVTIACSEVVIHNSSTMNLDCSGSGSDISVTYSSGSGTSSLIYTSASEIQNGETCNLDATALDIEDTSSNAMLTFSDQAVTNNSQQGLADTEDPVITVTPQVSGTFLYYFNSTPGTITGTATDNFGVDSITWSNPPYSGNGTGTTSWSVDIDLDESTFGTSVVTNGSFTTIDGWSSNNATITAVTYEGRNCIRVEDGGTWSEAYATFTVESGENYLVQCDRWIASGTESNNGLVIFDFGASRTDTTDDGYMPVQSETDAWETGTWIITPDSTSLTVRLYSGGSNTAWFDNLYVRKMTDGNSATITASDAASNTDAQAVTIYFWDLSGGGAPPAGVATSDPSSGSGTATVNATGTGSVTFDPSQ